MDLTLSSFLLVAWLVLSIADSSTACGGGHWSGMLTLCPVKACPIILQLVGLGTCHPTSADSATHGSRSSHMYLLKKTCTWIREFKPMLFKCQLYLINATNWYQKIDESQKTLHHQISSPPYLFIVSLFKKCPWEDQWVRIQQVWGQVAVLSTQKSASKGLEWLLLLVLLCHLSEV